MYFIFEMSFQSDKSYIADLMRALAQKMEADVQIFQTRASIVLVSRSDAPRLEAYLKALEQFLPASIYLGKSRYYESEEEPQLAQIVANSLPQNLSLCPSCQKEMFDVSSRRYYYPFTLCNQCGSRHAFVEHYPYRRENSGMKFLVPCQACKEEMAKNPLRKDFPLISCIECGIAIKMIDKKSQRYANDKGSYRTLFEVAARAIAKGKSVLVKTTHGYRKFFKPRPEVSVSETILLMTDANSLNEHLMMVVQEFNALLSIERPILRVATKSEEMKALFGSSTWVKYPDDGMTMLLAKELKSAGLAYLLYLECDETEEADFLIDFDIPISSQRDFRLFINQDTKLLVEGRRAIFPSVVHGAKKECVTIADGLASVDVEGVKIIDEIDRFATMPAKELYILDTEPIEAEIPNQHRFEGFKAAMLSTLQTHEKLNESAIGVHFDDKLHFLYYNQKAVIDVVPPRDFDVQNLFDEIAALREGSDRLVENFRQHFPQIYDRLSNIKNIKEPKTLFETAAILIGLEDESLDGISAKALSFLGKGGMQIDTKISDNRFNDYAFLASIMSYRISGVEADILCYSIYESFGDYIADIVTQLMEKTKAANLALSGESFANQSLWGRIQRNLGHKKPLLNRYYPIGRGSFAHGAEWL